MQASINMSYCGPPPLADEVWGRWNFDPWLIAILVASSLAFFASENRSRQRLLFSGAMGMLIVIFISPLCALTVALFSARVVHHVLLVAVAAPLLALAIAWRRPPIMLLTPLAFLHAVVFWLWHAPDAYQLALTNTPVYWLMQISLLGTATVLWSAIFAASTGRAIGTLLFLTIQMGLLGALLVFAGQPLYAPHFTTTVSFGLTAEEDQQLAGLIMWVPASLPYVAVGLWRLLQALRSEAGARA